MTTSKKAKGTVKPTDALDSEISKVEIWLADNVTVIGDVKSVVLSKFTWEQDRYSGHFYIAFDGVEFPNRFSFSIGESDGRTKIFIPMFHSPLGVPASFAAIEIPENVYKEIENEIRTLFPRITPFGRDSKTNKETNSRTPFHERLPDPDVLLKTVESITDLKFEILIDVGSLSMK
jgi:hypothetical protein